jgi:hypothetical protein
MRLMFIFGLICLVLAQAVYATSMDGRTMLHDDCCEVVCPDMLACNETMVCQACSVQATNFGPLGPAYLAQPAVFTRGRHDLVHVGPAHVVWTPPD